MKFAVAIVLLALAAQSFAAHTSTQEQILALLQTGTKASDAIDTVFDLLNDLKQQNVDAQFAADRKNETDEQIGAATIEKFTQVKNLNLKLFVQAQENRARFEQELQETKNYIAWNELRRDEIVRKIEVLFDNQCYSNQLFVRSIKMNAEALEVVKLLKQDVAGYVVAGDSFELVQMNKNDVKSIADKLKMYSNVIQEHQLKVFLALANDEEEHNEEAGEEGEEAQAQSGRQGTLAEKVHAILEELEHNLNESLENLKRNEIAAAWELASWIQSSEAEIVTLEVEHERKQVYADRLATQIQAALAQQAKSNIILQESQDALDQAISDLETKREAYAVEKAKRDEENAILDEVITLFKNQVASWSGRF